MPPIYIIQQGAKIRIHNRQVQVEFEQPGDVSIPEILMRVPLGHVSEIVLFGNVGLTTPAIHAFLQQKIEVVFLSQSGEYYGQLNGGLTPHIPLRRAQYQRLGDARFVLNMAQGFVTAKIDHQKALLTRHNQDPRDAEIVSVIGKLGAFLQEINRKTELSSLRGLEGAASAAYFGGLRKLFGAEWRFEKRSQRPPLDPVNVMLSLGYTLLANIASAAVQSVGMDPYGGFLHEVVYNRPALGLDLLEEFRPVVDGIVLWCCRSGQITPQNFSAGPPERPVILSEEGKRIFLRAFEQRLDRQFTHPIRQLKFPLRQCVIEQARQISQRILDNCPGYRGMGFR